MYNTFYELTNNEIKTALKDFKNYLQSKNNILKIDVSKADPLKENCYISSGSIAGVYFPNSIILLNDTIYDYYNIYNFVCIGKNSNEETGFYLRLKEEYHKENGMPKGCLQEVAFIPFAYISKEYFEIKNEIKKDIQKLKKEIEILKTFKLTPKKDGTPRENFRLNFEFLEIYRCYDGTTRTEAKKPEIYSDHDFTGFLYSFEIYFNYNFKIHYNLKEEEKQKYYNIESYATPEKIYKIVMDTLTEKENKLKELENILKNSLKIFKEAEKAKKQYINIKDKINKESNRYFNDYITKNLY